tara:strand:- start:401 stop:682 length:282 start_codon:yes stop_codon:yes gene_type:complete
MNYSDEEDEDYFYEEEDSYEGEDSYHYLEEFISAHLDNYYVQEYLKDSYLWSLYQSTFDEFSNPIDELEVISCLVSRALRENKNVSKHQAQNE